MGDLNVSITLQQCYAILHKLCRLIQLGMSQLRFLSAWTTTLKWTHKGLTMTGISHFTIYGIRGSIERSLSTVSKATGGSASLLFVIEF